MRKLTALLVVLPLVASCASPVEEDVGTAAESALVTLTPQMCQAPNIQTSQLGPGRARTELTGCILGRSGANGGVVIDAAAERMSNTSAIAGMRKPDGSPVFSRFTPRQSNGNSQEFDVVLNVDDKPYARIRVTRQLLQDGRYWINITNTTKFATDFGFIPITVVQPGRFRVDITLKPEANGIGFFGTSEVALEVGQDQAGATSLMVRDLYGWLRSQL